MSVLEAPQTWIAAAAVLVVIAVVLIALAPRRRSGAASAAAAAPTDAPAAPGAASSDGAAPAAAAPAEPAEPAAATSSVASPFADDDATTGPVMPGAAREPVHGTAEVDPRTADVDPRTAEVAPRRVARVAGPVDEPVTAETPPMTVRERYVPVPDPARADGRAKDRLLAALLADPAAAVDVVAAMPEDGAPASGSSAAALLRAGLSPAQVAQLCGVEAGDLATLVARDLGLLEAARDGGGGGAQRERSRTEEPGRAWASAGSAAGSTTPTTG